MYVAILLTFVLSVKSGRRIYPRVRLNCSIQPSKLRLVCMLFIGIPVEKEAYFRKCEIFCTCPGCVLYRICRYPAKYILVLSSKLLAKKKLVARRFQFHVHSQCPRIRPISCLHMLWEHAYHTSLRAVLGFCQGLWISVTYLSPCLGAPLRRF